MKKIIVTILIIIVIICLLLLLFLLMLLGASSHNVPQRTYSFVLYYGIFFVTLLSILIYIARRIDL